MAIVDALEEHDAGDDQERKGVKGQEHQRHEPGRGHWRLFDRGRKPIRSELGGHLAHPRIPGAPD